MIKEIKYIKDYGVFENFAWYNQLNEFKKFNLIYAWNYSGKTTLSRIFRSLETRQMHEDFSTAQFEIELIDGSLVNTNNLENSNVNVRVFNTDYVNSQLKWHEGSSNIEPIFILGEDNIKLQNQLDNLIKEELETRKDYRNGLDEYQKERNAFERALSKKAQDIKKELQLPDYNRTKLEAAIKSIKDSYFTLILTDDDYSKNLQISMDANKKESIPEIDLHDLRVSELFARTGEILERKIISNVITKLQENPELNEWVRKGKELHAFEDTCQFCGNSLPANLMDRLEQHFTDDFEKLFRDIELTENNIIQILKLIDDFISNCPIKAQFYPEFEKTYEEFRNSLQENLVGIKNELESLLLPLDYKRKNPFQQEKIEVKYAAATLTYEVEEIKGLVSKINSIIKNHNMRSEEFEAQKIKAKTAILNHHIAKFIVDFEYFKKLDNITEINIKNSNLLKKIEEIGNNIDSLKAQMLDASKGAQKVNEYLHAFFRHNRLKIEVQENGQFILKRNGRVAKNLSEGEKSAISFVYFITQLEDRNTNLKKTIVFIDDPICSLDQNHIHSVFAFIKAKFNPENCLQFFISTHNMEFFNLIKDLSEELPKMYKLKKDDTISYYFIERKISDDHVISTITPLPKELQNFKSEYVYLFSLLRKFYSSPSIDQSMIIPNIARRFLEAYLNFRLPSNKEKLIHKMRILFNSDTDRFMVYKLTNEYSHNDQLNNRSFYLPNLEECTEAVQIILRSLEERDKEHYDALIENFT